MCALILGSVEKLEGQYFRMYLFQVNKLQRQIAPAFSNKDQLEFSFDASIDWTCPNSEDGLLLDGFFILAEEIPNIYLIPNLIPANSDAVLILNEPRYVAERTKCLQKNETPKLKHFHYYSPDATTCRFENFLNFMDKFFGCFLPVHDFVPINESCNAQQYSFYVAALSSKVLDDSALKRTVKEMNANLEKVSHSNASCGTTKIATKQFLG
jgi:hypothetical protein